MLKTISILIAAVTFAAPAIAETFVHEGKTYVYSVEQRGNVRLIKGSTADNLPFELRVQRGWVDGVVNGSRVSFSTRDVVHLKPSVVSGEIAAR